MARNRSATFALDPLADTGPVGLVGVGTDERPDVVHRDLEDPGVVGVDGLEERDTRVPRDVRILGPKHERDRRGDSRQVDRMAVDDQFVRDQPVLQEQLLDELPEQFGRDCRPAIQRATRPARTSASGSFSRPTALAGRSVESVAGRPRPRTPS